MHTLLIALGAYLIGSISFASIVSRVFRLPDPRTYGSKNPGATNVLRTGNKVAAALTLLGDAVKGAVAVLAAKWFAQRYGLDQGALAAASCAVLLGHLYPIFHGFKGGKGVATALGILLALDWRLGAGAATVWLAVFALLRVSSLAALSACVAAAVLAFVLFGRTQLAWAILALALIVIARHRSNIEKLLTGKESGFGKTS